MRFILWVFPFFFLFARDGIEYTHTEVASSWVHSLTGYQSIHVLEIDPELYDIKPVRALDTGLGRESVLSMNERYGAIAAINGGFFGIGGTFDGIARGTLKIEEWYALPFKPRGCIGWSSQDPNPKFDRLLATVVAVRDLEPISVDGLNRPRKEGELILYTPCFNRTTLTKPDGEEVVVIKDQVTAIRKAGSTKIPEDGFVLSVQKKHPLFGTFRIGTPLSYSIQTAPQIGLTSPSDWNSLDYIVGGTPLLLHHQARVLDFSAEQTIPTFLSNRHARTAIGILPNGHWLLVVVDKTGLFDGMTMNELTTLMAQMGCVHAINLDGGGSSTMVYENEIKNTPHGDEDEDAGKHAVRRVSDAIVITKK